MSAASETRLVGWPWRALVAEAMLQLVLARLLVGWLPLRYWRRRLGRAEPAPRPIGQGIGQALTLARAVERAAVRLPLAAKCLPRAMALHAMMRRRKLPGILVIGIVDASHRGTIEDLHAWVEAGDEILIGALDQPFHPLVRFG